MPRYLNLFIIRIFLICFSISTAFADDSSLFYKNEQKFLPLEQAFKIDLESISQLIVLLDCNLPLCLSPMFIVGFLKLGTSSIPLDELPTTASTYFKHEK